MTLHRTWPKTLPLLAAGLLVACASVENAAPRVETLTASSSGPHRAQLEQGRTIYVTKCAKCHAPEPIRNYSASRWESIMHEMIDEAKLDQVEAGAVRAYVSAALRG